MSNIKNTKELINQLMQSVIDLNKKMYENTVIVLMNPLDIIELDMSDFSNHIWFIPESAYERGKCKVFKDDSEVKQLLYDFFSKHQDRMWTGDNFAVVL